jgi:hypothetical protein
LGATKRGIWSRIVHIKRGEQEGMEEDHTGVEALEMVVIEDRIGFMENKTI